MAFGFASTPDHHSGTERSESDTNVLTDAAGAARHYGDLAVKIPAGLDTLP